ANRSTREPRCRAHPTRERPPRRDPRGGSGNRARPIRLSSGVREAARRRRAPRPAQTPRNAVTVPARGEGGAAVLHSLAEFSGWDQQQLPLHHGQSDTGLTSFLPPGTNPDDALTAAPQGDAGLEAPQVLLGIDAAARRLDAGSQRFEQGMLLLAQGVVDPAPLAPLLDEAGVLEQPQLATDVGLRLAQGVDELTHAQAVRLGHKAAADAQADAVAQRREGAIEVGRREGYCHILKLEYGNMGRAVKPPAERRRTRVAYGRRSV